MTRLAPTRISFGTTENEAPAFIASVGLEHDLGGDVAIFATKHTGRDYVHCTIPRADFIAALRGIGLTAEDLA
jgi:hypothetical protein